MTPTQAAFDQLLDEHMALSRQYGAVQNKCSRVLQAQRAEIARLEAEVLRLRAAVVVRDTALASARDDYAALEASSSGLPRRAVLARRVDTLIARIQSLMRERLHWQWHGPTPADAKPDPVASFITAADVHQKSVLCLGDATHTTVTRRVVEMAGGALLPHAMGRDPTQHGHEQDDQDHLAALEASLVAADLVICQTGCLSHGAYWRVQDHCKRTGKTCVMVDQSEVNQPGVHQPQVMRMLRGAGAAHAESA